MNVEKLMKMDLYQLLAVDSQYNTKQITSAYRKKALKVHPDKNKGNPSAAEEFHLLSAALNLLTDAAARTAYDKVYQTRKRKVARDAELDLKTKKMKSDLEARERQYQEDTVNAKFAEDCLAKEVNRLRDQFGAFAQQERERLRKKFEDERRIQCNQPRLKISWKQAKSEKLAYTEDSISKIFAEHGAVECVLLSRKQLSSGVVEFATADGAVSAYESSRRQQLGSSPYPISLEWIGQPPRTKVAATPANQSWSDETFQAKEADILSRMFS